MFHFLAAITRLHHRSSRGEGRYGNASDVVRAALRLLEAQEAKLAAVLASERGRDRVSFTVEDHGPGILGEIRDKMFDWFESRTEGTGRRGAGLRLSIVRSFVELHRDTVKIDTVKIDSAPGRGTTWCARSRSSRRRSGTRQSRIIQFLNP
jgi:signal transduction histidine kinase